MSPLIALMISWRALRANKARSILTTLGIIIGVSAVITMVALTNGAKKIIEDQLISLGGKSLIINSGRRTSSRVLAGTGPVVTLSAQDAEAIKRLGVVNYTAPIIKTAKQVVSGNRHLYTAIVGTGVDFPPINDWYPEQGHFFIPEDIETAALVCVLGKTVANNLFGFINPIGAQVRIDKNSYTVLGVLSSKGQTPSGKDQDDIIIIPYTTYQKRLERMDKVEDIAVSVRTPNEVPIAMEQIALLLRERHNISSSMEDDFYIKSQRHVTERIFSVSKIMTILLASIASVSLLVGGIGIMNIMLVSVTERTKEIGIRIAVGAKKRDILVQFLIEAVLLSIVGGLVGVFLGIAGSKTSSLITGWPTVISITSVIVSFSFSAIVGIFFGLYPAVKASSLDPIEALRYE